MHLLCLAFVHTAELRADFRRYYGLDLHALPDGMTLGHAADLAACLPQDCSTHRAIDPAASWREGEYLMSMIEYELAVIRYMLSDGRGGKPEPIRPQRRAPVLRDGLEAYRRRLRAMQRPAKEVEGGDVSA